jgi:FKBP-type peptidyl-prolyl cis-trans isomerase 2
MRKEFIMAEAKNGDKVKVHYTGKLEDGTVFDSSVEREPLEFTLGQGEVIPGFEEAVVGMQPDESKTTTLPPEKGYGDHNPQMVVTVERERLPDNLEPQVGQALQMRQGDGQTLMVTVADLSESTITLDANHPLAGRNLTFDIQLVEIA